MQIRNIILSAVALCLVSACKKGGESNRQPQLVTFTDVSKPGEAKHFKRNSKGQIIEISFGKIKTFINYLPAQQLLMQSFTAGKSAPVEEYTGKLTSAGAIATLTGWSVMYTPDTVKTNYNMTYNAAGELIHSLITRIGANANQVTENIMSWENGNLVKKTVKTPNGKVQEIVFGYDLTNEDKLGITAIVIPGYTDQLEGRLPKNIRTSIKWKDNGVVMADASCHWEFDERGYPTIEQWFAADNSPLALYTYEFN